MDHLAIAVAREGFIAVLAGGRGGVAVGLLLIGGHLAPLVLHVEQERDERVLELLLVLELVAQRQLGDERLRIVLHAPLELGQELVELADAPRLQFCKMGNNELDLSAPAIESNPLS